MGKGRAPCCDKTKVKRGPWSPEEDLKLITFIHKHGHENWRSLPKLAGLVRCGKSCRLRWINYLRPDVKRGNFTIEEEETIIRLHQALGNKWSKIASHLPGRTDNEIKNVWNTHLKKRLPKLQESSTSFSSDSLISSNGSEYNNNEQASPVTVGEKQVSNDELNGIINIPEDKKESPTSFSSIDSNLSNSSHIVNYEPEEEMGNSLLDELLEIPMESDYDIWNMLDNSGSLIQSNLREEIIVEDDAEKRKWFNDLENELGLGAIEENQDDAAGPVMKKSELLDSDMGLSFLESSWPSWP